MTHRCGAPQNVRHLATSTHDVVLNEASDCKNPHDYTQSLPKYFTTVAYTGFFFSRVTPGIFSLGGVGGRGQQIQLRTEGRENGDLGAVAPKSGVPLNLQWVKPVFWLGCYGRISHGTGNSAQLCQNFGILGGGGLNPTTKLHLGTPLPSRQLPLLRCHATPSGVLLWQRHSTNNTRI
jgi:hypothetical protein